MCNASRGGCLNVVHVRSASSPTKRGGFKCWVFSRSTDASGNVQQPYPAKHPPRSFRQPVRPAAPQAIFLLSPERPVPEPLVFAAQIVRMIGIHVDDFKTRFLRPRLFWRDFHLCSTPRSERRNRPVEEICSRVSGTSEKSDYPGELVGRRIQSVVLPKKLQRCLHRCRLYDSH